MSGGGPTPWLVAEVVGGRGTGERVAEHWNRDVAARERSIASHGRQLRRRCAGHQVVATLVTCGDLVGARFAVVTRIGHVRLRSTQGLTHDDGVWTYRQSQDDREDEGSKHRVC